MSRSLPARGPAARGALRNDVLASIVVFLVALPLCIGVAVASGVPPELGLVTGIVGGLVTGALPGSRLQVSGPAAGLTVLVFEAVRHYGVRSLGLLVLAAGLIQLVMGALHLGRWFRAVSISVVQGMLAGIGLVLVTGQAHGIFDGRSPGAAAANAAALPGLLTDSVHDRSALAAGGVGMGTLAVLACWRFAPRRLRTVPGPLVAVGLAAAAAALFGLPVRHVEVNGMLGALRPPVPADAVRLAEHGAAGLAGVAGTILAFALIASAESLFSAAAVDRMHDGPRTRYDRELIAQGVGNTVCGALGALPMTAVIVRSAANVQAGARTRASRVLHGAWLLIFTVAAPAALTVIPLAALAAVLVHAGWKLLSPLDIGRLWRAERGEAIVLIGTALAIVATNLFEGVLIGILMAVAKAAWEVSEIHVETADGGTGPVTIRLTGNATFLRLPKVLDTLEAVPHGRPVELDLSGLRHLDHACRTALLAWAAQHDGRPDCSVRVNEPATGG